jgi:hypothetical protein
MHDRDRRYHDEEATRSLKLLPASEFDRESSRRIDPHSPAIGALVG